MTTEQQAYTNLPTQEQMTEQMGRPPVEWAGKCHGASMALAGLLGTDHATVRRGYFLGELDPGTYFAQNGGLGQHSWVELADGLVADPTRFAFKAIPPWPLWVGPADEYDIGGCKRAAHAGNPPDFFEYEGEPVELNLGSVDYVAGLLGQAPEFYGEDWIEVSVPQVFWLGNLPIKDREGDGILYRFFAAEVYEAIIAAGHSATIPIDRREWILGS